MNKLKYIAPLLMCILISFAFNSCSNNDPVTPSAAGMPSASVSMLSKTSVTTTGLNVTGAKFLVEFVKLEASRGHDDADVKEGPFVVDINLASPPFVIALNNIPVGTYNEVHFKIHKHTPNEVVLDPDFGTTGVGFSGIINGTYNGVAFTYRTAITANQEVDIDPPLVVLQTSTPHPVGASGVAAVNVTLMVDPSIWFMVNGQVANPMDPAMQHEIDENIRNSFRQAFEDDDCDGHPDHGH